MVESSDKKRFTVSEDGTRIRAAQGHSIAVELGLDVLRLDDVVGVEQAQRLDRLLELRLDQVARGVGDLDPPRRLEVARQPQAVEVLQLAQAVLLGAVGGEQLRVLAEDRLGPLVEHQVDGPVAERGAQLLVLGLALLPARGDGGDLAAVGGVDLEDLQGLADDGVQALGAQQHAHGHGSVPSRAAMVGAQ